MTSMAAKDATTQKWLARFRELMRWFVSLERVSGDNLHAAHVKGLAANYLAVKLGIFDPTKPAKTLAPLEQEPPYRMADWQCDSLDEEPLCRERKDYRRQRMKHWMRKAGQYGRFRRALVRKEVTSENIRRYRDCLRGIDYQARANPSWADVTPSALEANDRAVKLGLTHPDWILAMNLGLMPFLDADEIRQLPLPWKHNKPPIIFNGHSFVLGIASRQPMPDMEELLKRAGCLSPTDGNGDDASSAIRNLKNPVTCADVALAIHKRSDNVARTLRGHRYPVIIESRKSYCDAEDAGVIWPKWKERWAEKKEAGES
jgi:hypothetical protein